MNTFSKKFKIAVHKCNRALINNVQTKKGRYIKMSYLAFCELFSFIDDLRFCVDLGFEFHKTTVGSFKGMKERYFKLPEESRRCMPRIISDYFVLYHNFLKYEKTT